MLMLKYLQNNGVSVTLEAIDKPQVQLQNNMILWKEGLKHEQYVTS